MKGLVELADLGTVVEREDELSFDLMQPFLEFNEIGFGEIESVEITVPVGRIEIEQRRGPVVFFQNLFIGKALNLHPSQPFVRLLNGLANTGGIVVRLVNNGV